MSDFSELYQLYKNKLKSEGVDDQYILPEDLLKDRATTGIYTMLAVLYDNHQESPNLLDQEAWQTGERPDTVGIPKEARDIASRLLKREVEREDKLTLFSIRAERIELSPEAFDRLTALTDNADAKPNQALIDLLARKPRWRE
jgi:hypothetical protein